MSDAEKKALANDLLTRMLYDARSMIVNSRGALREDEIAKELYSRYEHEFEQNEDVVMSGLAAILREETEAMGLMDDYFGSVALTKAPWFGWKRENRKAKRRMSFIEVLHMLRDKRYERYRRYLKMFGSVVMGGAAMGFVVKQRGKKKVKGKGESVKHVRIREESDKFGNNVSPFNSVEGGDKGNTGITKNIDSESSNTKSETPVNDLNASSPIEDSSIKGSSNPGKITQDEEERGVQDTPVSEKSEKVKKAYQSGERDTKDSTTENKELTEDHQSIQRDTHTENGNESKGDSTVQNETLSKNPDISISSNGSVEKGQDDDDEITKVDENVVVSGSLGDVKDKTRRKPIGSRWIGSWGKLLSLKTLALGVTSLSLVTLNSSPMIKAELSTILNEPSGPQTHLIEGGKALATIPPPRNIWECQTYSKHACIGDSKYKEYKSPEELYKSQDEKRAQMRRDKFESIDLKKWLQEEKQMDLNERNRRKQDHHSERHRREQNRERFIRKQEHMQKKQPGQN